MSPRAPGRCPHYLYAEIAGRSGFICDDCGMECCLGCYVPALRACEPCADEHLLSADDLLALIIDRPGEVILGLAERARTAALTARFNQRAPDRYVPPARWYLSRVGDLIRNLQACGLVTCGHGHRRRDDVGPLCEWSATPRRRAVTA
jgi:hypothetical protein